MTDTSFALYRKYRPQLWDEVKNQDHITTVLKGAIEKGMIPHALLFTGSRGTGKTTVARIFARAIGAKEIDTYEIDAASNRGIDDIRELKNAVHTAPYESPYKVYIIDEVHMLTKEAFNALLKTLEEPPAHVIFILATTEADKLLDTITSRCQVFRFRTPTRAELAEIVLSTAKAEAFALDRAGAEVIALAADGSYRDALGITQKVMMASSDRALEHDEIAVVVGAPRATLVRALIEGLEAGNTDAVLGVVEEALTARVDMKLFMRLLLERVRTVLLLRHRPTSSETLLGAYAADEQALLTTIAKNPRSPLNAKMLARLLTAALEMQALATPQLALELALIEVTEKKVPQ